MERPSDGHDDNLIVLLHGRGDSERPFASLARAMKLPCTAALALRGPREVPFTDGGREWFARTDDATYEEINPLEVVVDAVTGEETPTLRRVESLDAVVHRVASLIDALAPVMSSSNSGGATQVGGAFGRRWRPDRVHLFGFSDGGVVALETALRRVGDRRLGGCAVVCAALLPEVLSGKRARGDEEACLERFPRDARAPTPLTLTAGELDDVTTAAAVTATAAFARARNPGCVADVHVVPGKGHGMMKDAWETRKLMAFWGMTLAIRPRGAMGRDVIEVGGDGGRGDRVVSVTRERFPGDDDTEVTTSLGECYPYQVVRTAMDEKLPAWDVD